MTHYSETSPLKPIELDSPPDAERLSAAVWRLVEAAHPRAHTRYTQVEVCGGEAYEGVVPAYVRVCRIAHVDAVLAIAQMIHESDRMASWWAGRPRRNPAGISVTGATRSATPPAKEGDLWQPRGAEWVRGQAYPNWVSSPGFPWRPNSVDAHIWRLAGYVHPRFSADQEALYTRACQGRPLPWFTRGSALTPRELGQRHNRRWPLAGWAWPGTHYGAALARIANELTRA